MINYIRKMRFVILFIITLLFCLFTAIDAELGLPHFTIGALILLVVTCLLIISGNKKRFYFWVTTLIAIKCVNVLLNLWFMPIWGNLFKTCVGTLLFFTLSIECIQLTLKDKTISITTLFGSLSAFLFIGLTFAYLYLMLYIIDHNSFVNMQPYEETRAIYYSLATLTTLGPGNIYSVSPLIQTLTWMESFIGHAYMALFTARLVGRYVAGDIQKAEKDFLKKNR
jgi:voltage-gated potassium channel